MKNLAAHYRPQTFAEVTGQDMITTVLSRAAEQDRVATAYLLSGTRGVGKTTIARILAKALNCKNAPTPEPCNVCSNCQMITKGNHMDVTEIDGASNNSVEDARALRENIGYAPMEGRYKVFIIDEAHMLSRSAFNALLKTLEEPPAHVVFILATTEAHKFPITIVSRCQHFIFKRLSEDGLVAHLSRVLTKEEIPFDTQALRVIARRAAGSVRDSMSLLAQTLALSEHKLDMESTRAVLGLAGQDLFMALMQAIVTQDCAAVIQIMQKLCDQGVDMGFFLRELTSLWRTLFLLREAGQNILPSLSLPEEEGTLWLTLSAKFSAAHLHAAWHMTLDAMRKIIHSPEPAAALELLLLNITLMPRLLPLTALQAQDMSGNAPNTSVQTQAPAAHSAPNSNSMSSFENQARLTGRPEREATFAPKNMEKSITLPADNITQNQFDSVENALPETHRAEHTTSTSGTELNTETATCRKYSEKYSSVIKRTATNTENVFPEIHAQEQARPTPYEAEIKSVERAPISPTISDETTTIVENSNTHESPTTQESLTTTNTPQTPLPSFEAIREHIRAKEVFSSYIPRQIHGEFTGNLLTLHVDSQMAHTQVHRNLSFLEQLLSEFCQCPIQIHLKEIEKTHTPQHTLLEEYSKREELQICFQELDAKLYEVRQTPKK